MKTFVMGDVHGAYKALKQCLERASFDYQNDCLIQLGDIADGGNEVYECVEELLKIKNLVAIKGNHDDWFCEYTRRFDAFTHRHDDAGHRDRSCRVSL